MLAKLVHAPRVQSAASPLLVLLHGLGADEQDLVGLAPELDPRLLVVSFRAPRRCEYGGYAWFDVNWDEKGVHVNESQALESRELLLGSLSELPRDLGVLPSQTFVGGFSQGAMMSLGVAFSIPERLDGVLLMSGRLLPEFVTRGQVNTITQLPFLLQHGTVDQVLPVEGSRQIKTYLESLGAPVTYREYPMAHEISQGSLADATEWLTEQLKPPQK